MNTESDKQPATPAEADSQGHSAKRIGEAIDDAVKALAPWQAKETAPKTRTRVLAAYVGVYEPCVGSMSDGRFYPDGQCGSEPFTHWMLLPALPNTQVSRGAQLTPDSQHL